MRRRAAALLVVLGACCAATAADDAPRDAETVRSMPFVADLASCGACHGPGRQSPDAPRDVAHACSTLCTTCHKADQTGAHHGVGQALEAGSTTSLPLTKDGRTACVTCHDLTRPRWSDVPWKAQSLFDRTFRSAKRYKTYYLVMRNDRGQLCKACH
jgi:hypothetical protein